MNKVLILIEEMYEDLELWYPKIRLEEAGFKTVVAGLKEGHIYKGKHGYPCQADVSFKDIKTKEFSGLIIPGGYAPDKLRLYPEVLKMVKEFNKAKKLVAFICHAGWVPISAGILKDRKATSYKAIKDDMVNAGVRWADKEVVVDENMISSRNPADLPAFMKAILRFLG